MILVTLAQSSRGMRWDANGLSGGQRYEVIARSETDALAVLQQQKNIGYRSVFIDPLTKESPDPLCMVQALSPTMRIAPGADGKGLFDVEVEYGRGSGGAQPDPVTGRVIWSVEGSSCSEPVDIDANGRTIANVVEEPLVPAMTLIRDQDCAVARWYQRAKTALDLQMRFRGFRGTVNSSTYLGALKGCLRFGSFEVTLQSGDGTGFNGESLWLCTLKLEHRAPKTLADISYYLRHTSANQAGAVAAGWSIVQPPVEGWCEVRLNKGRRTLGSVTDGVQTYDAILDPASNVPISEPKFLNAMGGELPRDWKPIALVFQLYPYAEFAKMPLPGRNPFAAV